MWWFKLIYSQGIYSSLAQLIQGGTPYRSQAYDNDVEFRLIHTAILLQKRKKKEWST
jgi:hypothetical protein